VIFSSPRFFVFLAVLLLLLAPRLRLRWKLDILLVASCVFYAAWDWRYLGLLLGVSAVNHLCGVRIHAASDPRVRRGWLAASVVASLGTLAYFKYTGFLLANVAALLEPFGVAVPVVSVLLPAGVSFYTFKTMSYTIDIYRRELEPSRTLRHYSTYVTFFPELIAGPIVRASVFLPQMDREIGPTADRLRVGASLFLLGLTKKLLIADRMATVADPIFRDPDLYATGSVWLGVLAYTIQIYCDFSGYSDMAVGTAKMIGYDLPRNFRMPYLAENVAEFWRRWHITLSTWLRDYLYIPLGGNRKGRARTYVNLSLTMLLGGLWHGASWNFVLWGGLHGAALALHRAAKELVGERALLPTALAIPVTFLFAMLCWVPFRSPDWPTTALVLRKLAGAGGPGTLFLPTALFACLALVLAGHAVGAAIDAAASRRERPRWLARAEALLGWQLRADPISGWYVVLGARTLAGSFAVTAWLLAIFLFAPTGTSPFLYFQF
jgi:alginate O-acetyltransferase complex protein AlgI